MKRVIIESPYAGDVERNERYLVACMRDSFQRGEAPFASHRLYPGILNDLVHAERELGIEAGLNWGQFAELTAVYADLGSFSVGMQRGIDRARQQGRPIEVRTLGGEWSNLSRRVWGTWRPGDGPVLAELEARVVGDAGSEPTP